MIIGFEWHHLLWKSAVFVSSSNLGELSYFVPSSYIDGCSFSAIRSKRICASQNVLSIRSNGMPCQNSINRRPQQWSRYPTMSLSLSDPRRFFLQLHRRNTLQFRRLHVSSCLGPLRLNIPLRHLQPNRECLPSFVPLATSPTHCRHPNAPGLLLSTPLSSLSAASIAQNKIAGYVMHVLSMSSP